MTTFNSIDWGAIEGDVTEASYEAIGGLLSKKFSKEDMRGLDVKFTWGEIQVKSSVDGLIHHLAKSLQLKRRFGPGFEYVPVAVGPAPASEDELKQAIEEVGVYVSKAMPNREEILEKAKIAMEMLA